jgi:hypothetical protein
MAGKWNPYIKIKKKLKKYIFEKPLMTADSKNTPKLRL